MQARQHNLGHLFVCITQFHLSLALNLYREVPGCLHWHLCCQFENSTSMRKQPRVRPLSQLAASPWAAVTCALLMEPCPHLQLLFLCLCRIPALCITYCDLLTNWQQLHFCLSCSARCGGYACVWIAGNAGVSTLLLDSHLTLPTGLGFLCSHIFTHLLLSVSATCSIHNVQESFFLLYMHFVPLSLFQARSPPWSKVIGDVAWKTSNQ